MLRRKILAHLSEWRTTNKKVALLLKGARQVGKTTSVREFGKTNYKSFIEINFIEYPAARTAFDGNLDARTILLNLSAMGFGPFIEGKTLVFFDEIQVCPNARTAVKFLVQDGKYDYILSGSLLGINYKGISSVPVGFEKILDMYPLDFEEFLWAKGVSQEILDVVRNSYDTLTSMPEFIHEQLMKHYREYLVVGGMPGVVTTFLDKDDISETLDAQNIILGSYRDDIAVYAGRDKAKAKAVFDAIPDQLGKKNKRFILSSLDNKANMRKYEHSTAWLTDAGIALNCLNVTTFELPFLQYVKRNLFKLYMVDTGLLCAMLMGGIQHALLSGDIRINEGAVTENYVAAELVRHGRELYYYDRKSRMELDFLISENNRISVIEVKSGNDYRRHTALDKACAEFCGRIERKIVLCSANTAIDRSGVVYYPLYMAMFL